MGLHIQRTWRPAIHVATASFVCLGIIGSISLASTTTPPVAKAATPPDTCFSFDSGTGTILSYFANENNDSGQPACPLDVDIPATIGGFNVTTIQTAAFAGRSLSAVTFPNTLTNIETAAFASNALTSVTLPSSLTTIGTAAFDGNSLTSLSIPNSVTSIGSGIVSGNPVTSLTIGTTDFSGTPQLQIGADSFSNLSQLTTVTLGANVIDLGTQAFAFNSALTNLTLSSSLTTIGTRAFYGGGLSSLSLPTSVTTIGDYAFFDNNISTLDLNQVQSIGDYAFMENNLTSVVIPNSVISLGGNMLFTANPLTSVTIGTSDFSGTPTLLLPDNLFEGSLFTTGGLTQLTLGNNILEIGEMTFMNNALSDVTIPQSVTAIGNYAFLGNDIQTVTIEGNPLLGDVGAPGNAIANVFSDNGYVHADMPSGLDAEQTAAYQQATAQYVRVYASDPTFTALYAPGYIELFTPITTPYVIFGYILNPATYAVYYESGSTTLSPTTISGIGPSITSYSLVDNLSGNFSLYYRAGDTVTLSAPTINGYTTPVAHELVLNAGMNPYRFAYTPIVALTAASTLSDTGANQLLIATIAFVCSVGAGYQLYRRLLA